MKYFRSNIPAENVYSQKNMDSGTNEEGEPNYNFVFTFSDHSS